MIRFLMSSVVSSTFFDAAIFGHMAGQSYASLVLLFFVESIEVYRYNWGKKQEGISRRMSRRLVTCAFGISLPTAYMFGIYI